MCDNGYFVGLYRIKTLSLTKVVAARNMLLNLADPMKIPLMLLVLCFSTHHTKNSGFISLISGSGIPQVMGLFRKQI